MTLVADARHSGCSPRQGDLSMNASGPPDDRLPDGESALLPDGESAPFAAVARPERSRTLAPAPRGETPAAFGRYQVVRALGSGGFGTVYLARDEELDRDVAIKVLNASSVSQSEIDQFLQEARRVARLRHSGIVAVHDVGVAHGQPYVVSEYLSGSSLSDWLKANRPSWQEAARIVAAMADALGYAHAHLTVHRDIKPANIILTPDRRPVIVDFGLSLDDTRSGGAEVGKIWGTPRYMAPEQVSGVAHRIDGRTDLYSLGVVLYEMLCGHVPFRSADLKELFRQVQHDEPQPPRQLVSDIPPALERVCLKALSKRMQDPHTTMSDFADAVRQITASALDVPSASQPVALPAPAPGSSHHSNPVTPASGGSTPSACTSRARGRAASSDRTGRRVRSVRV